MFIINVNVIIVQNSEKGITTTPVNLRYTMLCIKQHKLSDKNG